MCFSSSANIHLDIVHLHSLQALHFVCQYIILHHVSVRYCDKHMINSHWIWLEFGPTNIRGKDKGLKYKYRKVAYACTTFNPRQ